MMRKELFLASLFGMAGMNSPKMVKLDWQYNLPKHKREKRVKGKRDRSLRTRANRRKNKKRMG